MFRSLSEDDGGFVNQGLEICEGNGKAVKIYDDQSSTRIEIVRLKYDQKKLHDEMLYKKPTSKSSECSND